MASIQDLVEMNRRGELGSLLGYFFEGQLRELSNPQGQDFLIEFEEGSNSLTLFEVGIVIGNFYQRLGCVARVLSASEKFLDMFVHSSVKNEGLMTIVITLISPIGQTSKKHLRVSTTILAMPYSK